MKYDDADLIQHTIEGDQQAFAALVEKYQKQIHALVWQKIGDFHIAQEITQDVFLTAYHKLTTLKNPNRLAGWLYVIANRKCIEWHRKKKPQPESLETTDPVEIEEVFYSVYMTQQREEATNQKRQELVQKLLSKLQESERTVVNLYYIAEMTCEDIGKFLGVSTNTVRSRLHRARNRLKEEEMMIKENIASFQLPTQLTENIMKKVSRIKPAAPTSSKPLMPWAIAASTLAVALLILGFGNLQYLTRFQKPFSFDAQTEATVEIVDAQIVSRLDMNPVLQRKLGNSDALGESDNNGQRTDEVIFAATQQKGKDVVALKQQWIQSEPIKGNGVWGLLATPEEEVYVLDPLARLYKMHADGKEWQHIVDGRLFDTHWTAYPAMAKWKNTIYILSANELFASSDNGTTWNSLHSGQDTFGPVDLILTDQGFYAAFRDTIFLSADKGKTWKELNDGLEDIEIVSLVKIRNKLFACTITQLYRLSDDNWELLQLPDPIASIQSVASTENRLYVAADLHGSGWRIFRSTDLGNSWADITPTNAWPKEGQKPNITLVAAGETLLAMEIGMVRSTDAGDTWMPPQAPGTSPLMGVTSGTMHAVALNEQVFYVSSWDGLHRSTDGGKSWNKVNITSDINQGRIDNLIVYNRSNKGQSMLPTLYARYEGAYMRVGGEIVKSTDNGKSWKTIQMDTPMTAPSRKGQPSICEIVKSDGAIYAKNESTEGSGDTLLYRISADGKTFLSIQGMPDIDSMSLGEQLFFQKNPFVLPFVDPSKIIPIEKWHEHFSGTPQFFKQLELLLQQEGEITELRMGGLRGPFAVSGDTFYMEYNFKLFRWKRGDTEWYDTEQEETVELTPDIVQRNLKLAVSGNTVYVGKRDGRLVASFDMGTNWLDFTQALPFSLKTFKEIVLVKDTVTVATDAGVAMSDKGKNWREITDADGTNLKMELLTVDGSTLYGATKDTGIYRLESETWEQIVSDIPDSVTSLAVDGNTLYVGTKYKGMLHFTLED